MAKKILGKRTLAMLMSIIMVLGMINVNVLAAQTPELVRNHIPVSTNSAPMFDNVLRSKIEYLSERIVVCEGRLVLSDLPELSVQTLDNVRRIYYPSNLAWVCKKT